MAEQHIRSQFWASPMEMVADFCLPLLAAARAEVEALERQNRQLALDLQAAEARASGAEAQLRESNCSKKEMK